MRVATAPVLSRRLESSDDRPRSDTDRTRRRPVRPLDDRTTEVVQVIEFVLSAGDSIQPLIWLDRQLLH
jgi:hypothetical protein